MKTQNILVKIYDNEENLLGKGSLLSVKEDLLIIKGNNLPILDKSSSIIVHIYDERLGIKYVECRVSVASEKQLTAFVIKEFPFTERRGSLKVQTDFICLLKTLIRRGKDILDTDDELEDEELNKDNNLDVILDEDEDDEDDDVELLHRDVFIKVLNLSIGGMLFSSEEEFFNGDIIVFDFNDVYTCNRPLLLEAMIIRVDNPTTGWHNGVCYGCRFTHLTLYAEDIVCKYLFERQLQLFKNKE